MPRPPSVDVDALHRYLFSRTDSRGELVLNQYDLAGRLAIPYIRMHRIIGEMRTQGRLEKLRRGKKEWHYRVADPATWAVDAPAEVATGTDTPQPRRSRRPVWG